MDNFVFCGGGEGGWVVRVKRRNMIDDMKRRLLLLEKLEKEDVSKVKERVEALTAQWNLNEPLILTILDELARLSRTFGG